jgi:glycerol kinase
MDGYILAIDQGTTGSRVMILNHKGQVVGSAYSEFPQIYPQPGWVEHDPEVIWTTTWMSWERHLRQQMSYHEKSQQSASQIKGRQRSFGKEIP